VDLIDSVPLKKGKFWPFFQVPESTFENILFLEKKSDKKSENGFFISAKILLIN